jgi:hypothetical protein
MQRLETETRSTGAATLVGRMRGLRQDVQRKISRLRTSQSGQANIQSGIAVVHSTSTGIEEMPQPSSPAITLQAHSSAESLPSGSGSSEIF